MDNENHSAAETWLAAYLTHKDDLDRIDRQLASLTCWGRLAGIITLIMLPPMLLAPASLSSQFWAIGLTAIAAGIVSVVLVLDLEGERKRLVDAK